MKEVSQELAGICGGRYKTGYKLFCRVVEAAYWAMPEERSMQDLCGQVGKMCGKQSGAVYKAISRTTRDIWLYGDRRELVRIMGYALREDPSPKEMVMGLAQALWRREAAVVEYRVVENGLTKRYSVCGSAAENEDTFVLLASFSDDYEAARRLADRLNRERMTLRRFRELLLTGQLNEL